MTNNPDLTIILEKSVIPIEQRVAKIAYDKVRADCCVNSQCEGLCNVKMHEYRMLWVREWAEYARGN